MTGWRTAQTLVWTWCALLALLLASVGSAYLPLGAFNLVASLTIALVKTGLIARWFMRLDQSPTWSRLAALVAVCALALLAGLTVFEGATRPPAPASWQSPQQLPPARH